MLEVAVEVHEGFVMLELMHIHTIVQIVNEKTTELNPNR